jgi:hypothetical protein
MLTRHTPIGQLDKPARLALIGTIIATANLPDRAGNYPGMVVIAEHSEPADEVPRRFSTHVMYWVDDRSGSEPNWAATNGHYDLTLQQAWADFYQRVNPNRD